MPYLDTIPGTDYRLPGLCDLLQLGPGFTSRDWLAQTYGPAAVAAWEAAGEPAYSEPEPLPADCGVIRSGWGRTHWAKGRRYRV
jgi:hypothetical protein